MVEFQRKDPVITPCTGGENLHLSVEILVGIDDEDPEDIIEWSAMGLLFTLAALSFPRQSSSAQPDHPLQDSFCSPSSKILF